MILTTLPWRRAFLASLRRPALLALTVLAGFIVDIVATSPTLFVDAAGSGAVQEQWNRACPASHQLSLTWRPPIHDYRRFVEPTLASLGGFGAIDWAAATGSFTVVHDGKKSALGLLARTGFREHIDVISEVDTGVLWLPDTVASRIGATAGSTVTFGTAPTTDPSYVVRGIYHDVTTAPLDDYWCTVSKELEAATLLTDDVPPARALIDPADLGTFNGLGIGEARVIVPFATAPRTLTEARAAVGRADSLKRELPTAVVSAVEAEFGTEHSPLGEPLNITTDIDRLEAEATAVRAAVGKAVQPIALLAVASALAMANVLGLMWLRIRRNDAAALATLGISPAAIGAKAGLESVLPLMVGGLLGTVAARGALSIYAPASDLEPGTFTRAAIFASIATTVATMLVVITVALATRQITRHTMPTHRKWWLAVPWELPMIAATIVAWRGFRKSPLVALAGSDIAGVSTRALTFPLLIFVTGALLTLRMWTIVLGRRRRRRLRNVSVGLAGRRLRYQSRPGAALVACGVVGVAISTYGAGLVTSLGRTADAKVGVHLGSDVIFRVTGTLPQGTPHATQIARREKVTYGNQEVDLLALDPQTFANGAFWDSSFDDDSLAAILRQLSVPTNGAASALAVGEVPVAPRGQLTNTKRRPGQLDIAVVKRVKFFPGAHNTRPTIVIVIGDAERSGFKFTSEVWAKGTYEQWFIYLVSNNVRPVFGVRASDAINSSTLLFASWSFEFVRALGAFVGLQVVIVLLLQVASRQRKQALAFGLLRRMGLRPRSHWRALAAEVGAYAGAMMVAGIALAILAIRVVGVRLDPLPSAPPASVLVLPWLALILTFVAAVATAAVGTLAAQRIGERLNLAEALRDDQ